MAGIRTIPPPTRPRSRSRAKRLLKIAAVAFLAFELWRFALAAPLFVAFWNNEIVPGLHGMGNYPPETAPYAISATIIALVLPMVVVVFALRFLHRRLSRFRTMLTASVDSLLTKGNP